MQVVAELQVNDELNACICDIGSEKECVRCLCHCYREEQEKLNVWMAYVNLENMYGSQESLQEVFEKALQHNEPIKVFQQFITMCTASRKLEVVTEILIDCCTVGLS